MVKYKFHLLSSLLNKNNKNSIIQGLTSMKTVLVFLVVQIFILNGVKGANNYCSAYCSSSGSCTSGGYLNTTCSSCTLPTSFVANSCPLPAGTTLYEMIYENSFTVSNSSTATCSTLPIFYGWFLRTNTVNVNTILPISSPHYQFKFIVWIITRDQSWMFSDTYTISFYDANLNTTTSSSQSIVGTYISWQNMCGLSGQYERYFIFTQTYIHTDPLNSLSFKFSATNDYWGFKQYHIITYLCHPYCYTCTSAAVSTCSKCVSPNVLLTSSTTCATSCSAGTTEDSTNLGYCIACNAMCLSCQNSSTSCQTCAATYLSQTIYYTPDLLLCSTKCPTGFFLNSILSVTCQNCTKYCVTVNIKNQIETRKETVSFTVTFSQVMDFTTFGYTSFQTISIDPATTSHLITDFNITYTLVDSYSYLITIISNGFLMDNNTLFTLKTKAKLINDSSQLGYQFDLTSYNKTSTISWIAIPTFTNLESNLINLFNSATDNFQAVFTQPYVQEINKAGIFSFLLPGVQISSLPIVHNEIPSMNHYSAQRFWGQFVYFDVPSYEQSSTKIKYLVSKDANTIVNQTGRLLQNSQSSYWRFTRTGSTSYFIIDNYLQLILLSLSWIIVGICEALKRKYKFFERKQQTAYFFLHKVHEICLFYIVLGAILEFKLFDSSNTLRIVSMIFTGVTVVYLLSYQLAIFYKLLRYPGISVGFAKFKEYAYRYGYFLDDIRFQEYKVIEWSWRHAFRPYNYRIMSFYKKMLIIAAMPLFYEFSLSQAVVLVIVQAFDLIRYLLTWPFHSKLKNLSILFLEASLLSYFICALLNEAFSYNLFDSFGVPILNQYYNYYNSGSAAIFFLCLYNIEFLVINIVEIFIFCYYGPKQRMQLIRKQYYNQKLHQFEEFGQYYRIIKGYESIKSKDQKKRQKQSGKGYINFLNWFHLAEPIIDLAGPKDKTLDRIIKRGNLTDYDYDKLQTIPVIIEEYQICQVGKAYKVEYARIIKMSLNERIDYSKIDNLNITKRIHDDFHLIKQASTYFHVIDSVYKKYSDPETNKIRVKTFLLVNQDHYLPGQAIIEDPDCMNQKISVFSKKSIITKHLSSLMEGFPISLELLNKVQ